MQISSNSEVVSAVSLGSYVVYVYK